MLNLETYKILFVFIVSCLALAACGQATSYNTKSGTGSGPAISLSANPSLVAYNGTTTITWSSPDSTSCSSSPTGISGTSGTFNTPALTADTTYTLTCVGANGTSSASVSINVTGGSIVNAAAACAAEPMRGTVYYYCDCGTGAEAGCVAGSNSNVGTSTSAPRQTLVNAVSRFSTMGVNDTVALCKGGAFNSAGNLSIGSNRCGAGLACNDLREYTPTTFTGTAKPVINNAAGEATLFTFVGNGGIRFLNLKLSGDNGAIGNRNRGFFFYQGAHDVTMCNVDMDGFDMAVYNESGSGADIPTNNIKLTGSLISNSRTMGYLGGGNNDELSYNYWDGNGSSTVLDHTLYFGSSNELTNMRVVGNYIRGQHGSTCLGGAVIAHMSVNGLLVKDNVVDIAANASTPGCWGISFNNLTNAGVPIYHRNAIFSGNLIKNGGNTALTVSNCPGCVIENNLILNETATEAVGISVATRAAYPIDDVNTMNNIRNNTIWYGPNATAGGIGIEVIIEGTGHVIANNSVYYSAATTGSSGPFNCYNYPLAPGSYSFINNNHCYSAASYNWESARGSLALWRTASGFDTNSITGDPMFTVVGTDFTPATGSPLIGTGNAANGSLLDISGKTRPNPPSIGAFEP